MRRNKFNMGDTVKVITGENTGNEYQVIAISEQAVNDMFGNPNYIDFGTSLEYRYRLKSISDGSTKYFDEAELEIVPKSEKEVLMEQFSEYVNQAERIPAYRIGDVVTIPESSPKRTYVIRESIDYGPSTGIAYEIFRPDNTERILQFAESALEFQYHDVSWEYCLTEGSQQNGLPSWRGNLYNLFALYSNFDTKKGFDENAVKDYWNDTIPVHFMKHILDKHSIYGAIERVTGSTCTTEASRKIKEIFKFTQTELSEIKMSILNKLDGINLTGVDKEFRDKAVKNVKITKDELDFIKEVDKLDIVDGKSVSHFNPTMTNLQIMEAIKEAYNNAHKIGGIKIRSDKDLRTGESVHPTRGYCKYEGISNKHGNIKIHFLYSFDMNLITTAYPYQGSDNTDIH